MNAFWSELAALPANLSHHLLITLLSLFLGVVISLPLALLAARKQSFATPIMGVVSIIQTIPSLALLALMVPVLVGVNYVLEPLTGISVSEIGFLPTIVALTLYSLLPILRNSVTGLLNVDPAIKEAAKGVGMTPRQSLWKVEFPLALPVIVAGLRTATVWTVGIATLATPVGQRCLGNFIFRGLQTRNWTAVLVGCVTAACLAILLDSLIGQLQRAIEERQSRKIKKSVSLLAALFLIGVVSPNFISMFHVGPHSQNSGLVLDPGEETKRKSTIVIGAKTFTEQYILAELIARRLEAHGLDVELTESLGSTIIFDGLKEGEIDVYVEYTGTLWTNEMGGTESKAPWRVMADIDYWLEANYQVRNLGSLGFENAYALAMRRDQAERDQIRSIGDLRDLAFEYKVGGDVEIFGRPEWTSVTSQYDLEFGDQIAFDSTLMYEAIHREEVDLITAYTTDGRIAAYDLELLEDPLHSIPPYDAIILLSAEVADHPEVVQALQPLLGKIDIQLMQQANLRVDREENKQTIPATAEWLWKEIQKQ